MKASKRNWLLGLLVVAGLAALGGFSYYNSSKKIDYLTARIDRGDIESNISATGNCNAVITVQVGSQVSGNILELHADFNSKVTKNELVAVIDPAPFQAKVDQAKANVDAAKAAVLNAQSSVKKSDSDIASAEANVANQKANVVRAKSAVTDAQIKLDHRKDMFKQGVLSAEDQETAQATYDQAVAGLDAANAQVTASQTALESAKAQRDVAKAQLDSAQAQVKQQEASLVTSQLDLDHTQIRAPVDGTVIARNMDRGQTVAASFSAPTIFQIAQDLTKMQVDANIDESDIGRVKLGQPASFTVDAYPGQVFRGQIYQIREAPINVQNVITYDVVIRVDNPDLKLFPGMTANVRILADRVSDVLRVPSAAFRFRPANDPGQAKQKGGGGGGGGQGKGRGGFGGGGQQTIYILGEDGTPKPQRVRVGIGDGNFISVTSDNVHEGDQVITGIVAKNANTGGALPGQQQQQGNFKNKGFF